MANNHNDYEELSSLLYPSIEASDTGAVAQQNTTEYVFVLLLRVA